MSKIIIANWKLNLNNEGSLSLANSLVNDLENVNNDDIVICPNFVSLTAISNIFQGSNILLGAQDVFWETKGAFTGEVSLDVLKEINCEYIIVGHSERRILFGETDAMIHKKIIAILKVGGITPVLCIGETEENRQRGKADFVLSGQLEQALGGNKLIDFDEIIVAYEPIWAIGTGDVIEPTEAEHMHGIIKSKLKEMFGSVIAHDHFRIIYGGSINKTNALKFKNLKNVDGLLVGGASTNRVDFNKIIKDYLC